MKFYHLSDKPFTKLRKRKLGIGFKPSGIWLAPSGVWKKYIQEELGGEIPKYEYEFDIDMSKVLTLNTYKDISEFQEKYKDKIWKFNQYNINWDLVKKDYDGIYIKNAQIKKARDEFMWYSMFDIESICVWANLSSPKLVDPS
uniref:Uncharacterized protein n=1 Tax=viral metagenome TaxID=1070528 RepID=A0A6C0HF36_9ZZZZ